MVAFATHGLVAGELEGVSEPALVLTPPAEETETDDGLLIASVLAHLKLNADWVTLSACNVVAAGGTLDVRGRSELAKVTFYAGNSAVLVTLWPVVSGTAEALIARTLVAARIGLIRAETHRQAMIENGPAHNAHPALWAPFANFGKGGEWLKRLEILWQYRNKTSARQGSSVKVVASPRNKFEPMTSNGWSYP